MTISNDLKSFFLTIWTVPIKLWHNLLTPLLSSTLLSTNFPPPPSPSPDLESAIILEQTLPPAAIHGGDQRNLEWTKLIIAFCFTSAIEMAVQSTQSTVSQSPLFPILSLAIMLAFATLFVAKFIDSKFFVAAQVLERVGFFFAATAFFLAVSTPFPLFVKCISWAVYAASMLVIFVCHRIC